MSALDLSATKVESSSNADAAIADADASFGASGMPGALKSQYGIRSSGSLFK